MFEVALTKGSFFVLFYMFMFDNFIKTALCSRIKAVVDVMSHFCIFLVNSMRGDLQLKLRAQL